VSLTLAVQDETAPKTREDGAQETVMTVEELIEGTVEDGTFVGTRPELNQAGEKFATVDPRLGTVASDGALRNNTKDTPTTRMKNANAASVLLKVRLNGKPKLKRTVLGIVPPLGASEPFPNKRISNMVRHS
jgi:hypothetical protein